ncbi:calcitonin gene-related peptide type 1 receptor-like [Polypterus senegalus]|uniref:calcitonin gene-related peptide type 1 receptor-like n=1 Tax=Polypterus senegalus TaxID=55291 RepID=UPI0019657462|nr:calcitonin gene-related peptide type 1 receptor-like [Polypterus senegalus]
MRPSLLLAAFLLVLAKASKVTAFLEETQTSAIHPVGGAQIRIMSAQFECYLKILNDPPHKGHGPYCNRTWDGWLCWDDSPAGTTVMQLCPDYYKDFDPSEKVTKVCNEDGQWFQHPESNRTWTNYTLCTAYTGRKLKTAVFMFYLAILGQVLSLISLIISLCIFFYFRNLSCQRISLHKNLFLSFILYSIVTIIWLSVVVYNQDQVSMNPVGCRVLSFLVSYTMVCNYFWMLCEGIYLHTLIIVAVFVEKQKLCWYYMLGWGFPLIPATMYAVARLLFFNDNCWISSATNLVYIIHGPIHAALVVNLIFLLNIMRVLITKMKLTHRAESYTYMKLVRATLILIPLLGIQFLLVPWTPKGRLVAEIHEFITSIFLHYQGLLVATIFCFCNGEVVAVIKRVWMQYKFQCGGRLGVSELHSNCNTSSTVEDIRTGLTNGKSSEVCSAGGVDDSAKPANMITRV